MKDTAAERLRKRLYAANRPEYAHWYTKPRWRKLRAKLLSQHPDCIKCGSKATEVDHIVAHKGHYGLFYSPSNLQCLCKRCHSSKTARESNFAKGGKDKLMGRCGVDGLPMDSDHPWNK